jgi:hypothetical protein
MIIQTIHLYPSGAFWFDTSTPWRFLPARELGCRSPATWWRRLTERANAGVFDRLHLEVLDRLGEGANRSIVASAGASSIWSAMVVGCR